MKIVVFALLIVNIFSCHSNKNPQILIKTNYGNIEAELFVEKAPITVAAFLSYIDSGYFKNSSFYRTVIEETNSELNKGIIQGGIWQSNNTKANQLKGIFHESPKQTGISHTSGTLSLARTKVGTANTEFFICIGNQSQYDSSFLTNPDGLGYAAFGKVLSGMEIVRKIQILPANNQTFLKPIQILNIERI